MASAQTVMRCAAVSLGWLRRQRCGYGDGDIRNIEVFVCLFQVFSGGSKRDVARLPGYYQVAHHM